MDTNIIKIEEIECHQIQLSLKDCRVDGNKGIEELKRSLAEDGQQQPVVVCRGQADGWVLLDGYRRYEAMRRLGKDLILAEIWACPEAEGTLRMLGRETGRSRSVLEEARLVQQLVETHGCSKEEVAKRLGKSPRWVRSRLALIHDVEESWWEGIGKGKLSSWSVSRVLLPLKRINHDHAEKLVGAMEKEAFTTRELETWFRHYQNSTRRQRERQVENPGLFLQVLANEQSREEAKQQRAGPEGECIKETEMLLAISRRLRHRLIKIAATTDHVVLEQIESNVNKLCHILESLKEISQARKEDENVSPNPASDPCLEEKGNGDQNDRQDPQNFQEYSPQRSEKPSRSRGHGTQAGRRSPPLTHPRTLYRVQGQRSTDQTKTEPGIRAGDRLLEPDSPHQRGSPTPA
jgi:ParB/RepB/Spo0J family partition protein